MATFASWSPRVDARAWAGATVLGGVLFAASWALLHAGFWSHVQIVDTPVYQRYGEAIVGGQVPYRDFDLEYPPGALAAFVLPSLAGAGDYRMVFEWLMLACGLATVASVTYGLAAAGASPRRLVAGAVLVGLSPLALGPVVLTRFDLWPAALTAGALAALASDRSRLGLGLLAAATAAKLYPLVIVPLALLYVARRRGRRESLAALGVFALVLAAVVVPFAVLAPDGLWASIERQTGRPLQVESLGAAALLAAHRLGAGAPTVVSTYGSQNVSGGAADALAGLLTGLQAVAVAGVWALFAQRRADASRLLAASAAAVAAFVAFGKVLSPQFLIWLVPLVALALAGTSVLAPVLLVAALVLTQVWFPVRYWDYVALGPQAWAVLARDLVLVALFGCLALAIRSRREAPRMR
jgi:hypothetical protein